MDPVMGRLDALEREVRTWRLVGVLAFVLVVIACLAPATSDQSVVQAERFVVVDSDGQIRASLGMNPFRGRSEGRDVISLVMSDHRGEEALRLDTEGLEMQYRDGTPMLSLGSLHGAPVIFVMGGPRGTLIAPGLTTLENGDAGVRLGFNDSTEPQLAFTQGDTVEWSAP